MKRKMSLLEQAHGLLCNAPTDGTSAETGDEWRRLRDDWICRWAHLIADQQTKEHNARIQVRNEAIADYEQRSSAAYEPEPIDEVRDAGTPGKPWGR